MLLVETTAINYLQWTESSNHYNMLPYPPAGSGKPSGENHPERQCEADSEPKTRAVNQEDAQIIENIVKQEATVKELTSMSDLTI